MADLHLVQSFQSVVPPFFELVYILLRRLDLADDVVDDFVDAFGEFPPVGFGYVHRRRAEEVAERRGAGG